MRVCALASGSKGNSCYVGNGRAGVLIDAGLSGAELMRRLAAARLAAESVAAIVVTHEHRDHCHSLGVLARKLDVPVWLMPGVERSVEATVGHGTLKGATIRHFEPGVPFEAGGLSFTAFSTSHDAASPVGFRVTDGARVLGFATDLGVADEGTRSALTGADALVIESNHDEELLRDGPYPWFLKKRIGSERGHLSNEQSGDLLSGLLNGRLKAVVLAHLSETNNEPRLAYAEAVRRLSGAGADGDVKVYVARQDLPGSLIEF